MGRSANDPIAFKAAMALFQQRLAADVPAIWLYHERRVIIANKHIVNLTKHQLPDGAKGLDLNQGAHPLYQVWRR
jgi:hypothetical protein